MANTDTPRGLWPIRKIDGSPYNGALSSGSVDASNATAIFKGDAVKMEDDGNMAACAAGDAIRGVMAHCEYTNSAGEKVYANYLPATTAGTIYFTEANDMVFGIQEDSDGGALAATAVGANADIVAGAGSTTTGVSAHELDSSDLKTATAQLRILALHNRVDNEVGTNADWEVAINEPSLNNGAGV